MATKSAKKNFIFAVGRRKSSVARVRLYPGRGETLVNGQPADQYFDSVAADRLWPRPLEVTKSREKYYATAKIEGGGKHGQLEAFILGVARALAQAQEENKAALRQHGFLTRDARVRERRKVGTGGKARRKKQSPKR